MAKYGQSFDRIESQSRSWASVTPADGAGAQFTITPKGLYVGGAGTIALRGDDGVDVTFTVVAGAFLPLCAIRVLSTGTTATGIVALF